MIFTYDLGLYNLFISKGVKKHIAMRNMDDKKGGGLMILYREEEKMELKIEKI